MLKSNLFAMTLIVALSTGHALDASADTFARQSHTTTLEELCPAEWRRFSDTAQDEIKALPGTTIDPDITPASMATFNKYATAVVILARYMSTFVGFSDAQNHTPAYFVQARAELDLVKCLHLSEDDREKMVKLSETAMEKPKAEIRAILFSGFDKFECMNFLKASEMILAKDPADPSFKLDFGAITEATMKRCD